MDQVRLLTFGHGTASAERMVALLHGADVTRVVDVRTAPGSRRNPHVARSELERWLPDNGIEYRWEKRLGGWRKARPDSPDTALRERAFAGYAAYMRSPEFRTAADDLLDEAAFTSVAVMCAESLWWRCHRRMIADYVALVRGVDVRHLMHDGRLQQHVPTDVARLRDDGLLVYDGGHEPLPYSNGDSPM